MQPPADPVSDALPVERSEDGSRGRCVARAASRGVARLIRRAAWKMRLLDYSWPIVEKELATTVKVPWNIRPLMWRRGFLSESWVLYDLRHNDWRDYLPDRARFAKTRLINGAHAVLLDDKIAFQRFVGGSHGHLLPAIHGVIRRGRIMTPGQVVPYCANDRWLSALVRGNGRIVIKPASGGGGRDVSILRAEESHIRLNGRVVDDDDLRSLVAGGDGLIICEHVSQHPDLAGPYPYTTNTLRLLLMQDHACRPFIAAAVWRIGTRRSAPTDNWTRGGLSAEVRLKDGLVGKAASYPAGRDTIVWNGSHPETGKRIEGLRVPHWDRISQGVIELMGDLPMLRYVGWDVVVTPDGFRILEGNNYSDVNLLQIHRPLLRDARVLAFYRRNGVLPAERPKSRRFASARPEMRPGQVK